jgi:hypothetical protein
MTIPRKDDYSRNSHFFFQALVTFVFLSSRPDLWRESSSITGMVHISGPRVMLMMAGVNLNAADVADTFGVRARQINKICQVYSVLYTYIGR